MSASVHRPIRRSTNLSPLFDLFRMPPASHGMQMKDRISPFWIDREPLILASASAGRQLVLRQAGLPFEARPADVDERALEASLGAVDADHVAGALARAKALAVSENAGDRWVIGADQVASCGQQMFGKPPTREKAAELLRFLSGRGHRLHSAVTLVRSGEMVFETVAHADLEMRVLSDAFIDSYLDAMGDAALTSAGAYQVEGLGAQLFRRVTGDHWTIIGLPILPVLEALRQAGVVAS